MIDYRNKAGKYSTSNLLIIPKYFDIIYSFVLMHGNGIMLASSSQLYTQDFDIYHDEVFISWNPENQQPTLQLPWREITSLLRIHKQSLSMEYHEALKHTL